MDDSLLSSESRERYARVRRVQEFGVRKGGFRSVDQMQAAIDKEIGKRQRVRPVNLGAIDRLRFNPVRSYGIRVPVIPRVVRAPDQEKSRILARRNVGFFREE
jgi:hypothetical protein